MKKIFERAKCIRRGKYCYKFETDIFLGESEDVLGAVLLYEPDNIEEEFTSTIEKSYDFQMNDTIKQIVEFIHKGYGEEVEGIVKIFYLIPFKTLDVNYDIDSHEKENYGRKLLYRDFEKYKGMHNEIPFLLIGWGCDPNERVNDLKTRWLDYLDEYNINYFGVKGGDSKFEYLKPVQKIKSKKDLYMKTVIKEFNKQIVTVTIV